MVTDTCESLVGIAALTVFRMKCSKAKFQKGFRLTTFARIADVLTPTIWKLLQIE